jgi:hypothetical protein
MSMGDRPGNKFMIISMVIIENRDFAKLINYFLVIAVNIPGSQTILNLNDLDFPFDVRAFAFLQQLFDLLSILPAQIHIDIIIKGEVDKQNPCITSKHYVLAIGLQAPIFKRTPTSRLYLVIDRCALIIVLVDLG